MRPASGEMLPPFVFSTVVMYLTASFESGAEDERFPVKQFHYLPRTPETVNAQNKLDLVFTNYQHGIALFGVSRSSRKLPVLTVWPAPSALPGLPSAACQSRDFTLEIRRRENRVVFSSFTSTNCCPLLA